MVVCGIAFMVVWIFGHMAWAAMAFIANAMANDSGRASEGSHLSLIISMLGGQILCGGAGIPAGMAFFMPAIRARLLWIFTGLFVLGALIQVSSFFSFFAAMP